jgi:hypothetical protein
MNKRDTKTVKIVVLWLIIIVAITEVSIMVDVGRFIDKQNELSELSPDTKY